MNLFTRVYRKLTNAAWHERQTAINDAYLATRATVTVVFYNPCHNPPQREERITFAYAGRVQPFGRLDFRRQTAKSQAVNDLKQITTEGFLWNRTDTQSVWVPASLILTMAIDETVAVPTTEAE